MRPINKQLNRSSYSSTILRRISGAIVAIAATLLAGCKTDCGSTAQCLPPTAPPPPIVAAPVVVNALQTIRINAGAEKPIVDAHGQTWLPDQGFEGGEVVDRGEVPIANTSNPALYRTERYGQSSFSRKLPNGKYTVKLHFAETFEGITAAGERVFSFKVEGQEFKDFDVFAKAGGANKAYVESVAVEITDGQLNIIFTSNIENPEINGIEIIPVP